MLSIREISKNYLSNKKNITVVLKSIIIDFPCSGFASIVGRSGSGLAIALDIVRYKQ